MNFLFYLTLFNKSNSLAHMPSRKKPCHDQVNPNVAYPRRGKTRQSASNMGAHRLGQDEQYLTVREILSEASTLVPPRAGLSRERSDCCRFEHGNVRAKISLVFLRYFREYQYVKLHFL
jgi:hypothetical protein